jgi:hypothetical protein
MADRKIVYAPLDEIEKAAENAKLHDPSIGRSIKRFGVIEIMAIDDRTERLVSGHGRLEELIVARENGDDPPDGVKVRDGAWLAPTVRGWASKDDQEAKAAGVALNETGRLGGNDQEELDRILDSLDDLTGTGFDVPEVDLSEFAEKAGKVDYGLDEGEELHVAEEELRPYEFGFVLIRFELDAAGPVAKALQPLDGTDGVVIKQTIK